MQFIETVFGLDGKTALVTGAGRGIGRATCLTLAGMGATVVCSDRDLPEAEATAAEIKAQGGKAFAHLMDIEDPEAIVNGFAEAEELLGGTMDILVNNAGMVCVLPLFEDRMEIWDKAYRVNVRGTFICSREGARIMRKAGRGGRIINISSTAAVRPVLDGAGPYSASKGGVSSFSNALCYELAPDNITVNVIMPHAVFHPTVADQYDEYKTPVTGGQATAEDRYRLPRQGNPQDIASLAAFLAGPSGAYISGQHIAVDGGYLLT